MARRVRRTPQIRFDMAISDAGVPFTAASVSREVHLCCLLKYMHMYATVDTTTHKSKDNVDHDIDS
jgi:hypothetical protein